MFYQRKENDWRLGPILLHLVNSNTSGSILMLFWLLIDLIAHSTTTYSTVQFLSSANIKMLSLLLLCESFQSLVRLKVVSAEKSFILSCVHHLHTLVHQRILKADWHRFKLADREEMKRKIEDACSSIQAIIETIIDNVNVIYTFISATVTIILLCPWQVTFGLIFAYLLFFLIYVRQRSQELFTLRLKHSKMYDDLYEKRNRVVGRTLDYVLHRECDNLVNISGNLQVTIESLYFIYQYLTNRLLFAEEILGKISSFIIISILLNNTTNQYVVIPIYHYLSSLVNQIDNIINLTVRSIRLIKDYDLLEPLLNEYQPRIEADQFDMKQSLTIENLSFTFDDMKMKRKRFKLELVQPITFRMGDAVLVNGASGAGKSTFYDIISGCISNQRYKSLVKIDNNVRLPNEFHNIEAIRTLVLQDTQMDFKCSIYTMITDIEEDNDESVTFGKDEDERIWHFLRLVEIDSFVEESLQGQLHVRIENRLSGGQKTRLMLARALNRAEKRQSQIIILDEPDRGLPSETTYRIMLNIIQWYRSRGILFVTLHNDRVRDKLPFDHFLHIEHGQIKPAKSVKVVN